MSLQQQVSSSRAIPVAAVLALFLLGPVPAARAGNSWIPLGPDLVNDGQTLTSNGVQVTGRINVVAPNPANPLGDVWIGSAGGGVWHGSVWPNSFWEPMTDDAPSLAVGALALDSCLKTGCATVWAGTGEDSIRRDTQYGRGILKGKWDSATNVYDWTLLGESQFARGAITKIVLDPTTPDDKGKVLFAALSTGETSNGSHSTVTTTPAGALGVWRSKDAGQTWFNVLGHGTPATDLEMDPQDHNVLFAGLRHDGIYRSVDGGDTWKPMSNGIPASLLAAADWPELAVHRTPGMSAAILYVVLGSCPHPQTKPQPYWCSPAIFGSVDGGSTWQMVDAQLDPPAPYGAPITGYASYTHALTIDPINPFTLWYGGINLYKSVSGGLGWDTVADWALHPDHHQVVVFEAKTKTGEVVYDVNDGGLFVGDGENGWGSGFQQGLAVTLFQSVSAAPKDDFLMGGTQDNGTLVYQGTEVWETADDGDSASTLIDLDNPNLLYDVYFGATPRRCEGPGLCQFGWPFITSGLGEGSNASWYPPLVQDPTAVGGQHPLYTTTTRLYRSVDDGDSWTPISGALGGGAAIPDLAGIQNPISAVAVAPGNPNRIYVGYYDGKVFTTADGQSASPTWTQANAGLPGRPVTALAVHPADEKTVFAAFAGLAAHSLFRSTTAGASWGPLDDSVLGDFAGASVNTLAIQPASPYAVWAGTDSGIYSRDDADSSVSLWFKSGGLPNVAVYDLELAKDGQVLYAATHGRGVWRLSLVAGLTIPDFYEEACCGYFDPYQPAPFVSVSVDGFDPGQRCSMSLYEGSRLCSTATVDADGGALATDAHGFLVSSKDGYYANRKVAWACQGGACVGGVPWSRCNVSEVEVACGRRSVHSGVRTAQETKEAASTQLGFAPAGREGSFTLTPTIKRNGGLSTPLCSVALSYAAEDDAERVLTRAADAVSSDARCQAAGVRASIAGSTAIGTHEDEGLKPFRLSLSAPEQVGVQLITEVTGNGLAAFSVGAYGVPRQGSRVVPRLAFAGRGAGGRVEVTESSPLGVCTFGVDTLEGDAPETVAAGLQRAFLGRPDTSVFQPGSGCPARQNARDVNLNGAVLQFALGQQVSVRSTDPGLSFTLGSER
ncbi:MAG TPA: hypothetical protein VIA62_05000 [Thermoanaerobaculia bacterium]|nr:hypothetical protein [Thermoanaerobaculia bacterium]